jgi:hypothetical protein
MEMLAINVKISLNFFDQIYSFDPAITWSLWVLISLLIVSMKDIVLVGLNGRDSETSNQNS